MASIRAATLSTPAEARSLVSAGPIPWYVWTCAIAVTSVTVGLYWNVSWHMSIGRDTFWTPAHVARLDRTRRCPFRSPSSATRSTASS